MSLLTEWLKLCLVLRSSRFFGSHVISAGAQQTIKTLYILLVGLLAEAPQLDVRFIFMTDTGLSPSPPLYFQFMLLLVLCVQYFIAEGFHQMAAEENMLIYVYLPFGGKTRKRKAAESMGPHNN